MNPHQIIRFKWIYETLSYSRVQDLPPPAVSLQRHHTSPGLMEHVRGWRRNHKLNWKNRLNKSMTLPWNIFTLQICKIDILVTSNCVLWITLKKIKTQFCKSLPVKKYMLSWPLATESMPHSHKCFTSCLTNHPPKKCVSHSIAELELDFIWAPHLSMNLRDTSASIYV